MSRKEGGLVLSVQGGRMEVLINQEKRSLNLAQIWKENYLPVKGMVNSINLWILRIKNKYFIRLIFNP